MRTLLVTCCLLLFSVTLCVAYTGPRAKNTPADVLKIISRVQPLVLKNPDSARKLAEQSLLMAKRLNYGPGIGKSFYQIAISYWAQAIVPVSQFYLNLALPYLKADRRDLAECYTSMARNYVDLKMYDKAQHYYNLALNLTAGNITVKASVYTDYTALFAVNGEHEKCLRFIDTALKYNQIINDNEAIAILYGRRGQVYLDLKRFEQAASIIDSGYYLALKTENKRLLSSLLIFRARVALGKKNYDKARTLAEQGCKLADELGSAKFKQRGLSVIAGIFEAQGNYKKAFEIAETRLDLRRSTENVANERSLQLVQDYVALNKKLNDIEIINRKNRENETQIKQQHKTIALLVVLLFTTVAILGIIYFFYKQNSALNSKLQQQHQTLLNQKQFIEMQHADLESATGVKDKLLAIVGHDLRTPIANLSSIADLFAAGLLSPKEVQKLMTDIVPVVRGAELTLSNLTDFAGNQIKGKKVNTTRFDICCAITETEEVFRHQLKQKGVVFIHDNEGSFFVNADESQIKVILRNLISNAIKFTDARGQITVSMRTDSGQAVVCIRDNGVGMTEEQAAKLFSYNDHFSEKGTMGEKGTGIGLLLCKELVTLNKGRIWLESPAEGGCKVCFTIPLAH